MESESQKSDSQSPNEIVSDKASQPISSPFPLLPSPSITHLKDQAQNLTLESEDNDTKLDPKEAAKIEKQNQRKAQRELARLEREKAKEEERQLKLQQREAEKAERERKKEEERLNREEKKRQDAINRELKKQEEKERREQERLLKKQQQEEERQQKREEKKRKIEEDNKKKEDEKRRKEERSQMRISSFFSATLESSAAPKGAEQMQSSPIKAETKQNSYEMDFLPFFQKKNVVMAPQIGLRDTAHMDAFSEALKSNAEPNLDNIFNVEFEQHSQNFTTSQQLVEALNSPNLTESAVLNLVKNLPQIKYLQFYENSKPPFVGTWCSQEHLKICASQFHPLDTTQTGYDYGYDSDLDWQDEDEGEDIDDLEDGDEEEEEGDDDMDDFVDNSELRKKGIVGPQQATCIWNLNSSADAPMFNGLKYEALDVNATFPIDPFKNYWGTSNRATSAQEPSSEVSTSSVNLNKSSGEAKSVLTAQRPTIQDPKVVEELIKFIEKNSDFTIGTLTELAKKEFKSYTKNILKYTIQSVAVYNKKENGWKIRLQ